MIYSERYQQIRNAVWVIGPAVHAVGVRRGLVRMIEFG